MEVTSFFEEVRREKDITDSGTEFSEKRKFFAPKKNATFRACVFLDLMVVLLSSFFVRKSLRLFYRPSTQMEKR